MYNYVLAYIQMDIISFKKFLKKNFKILKLKKINSFLCCGMDGNHPTRDMTISEVDI